MVASIKGNNMKINSITPNFEKVKIAILNLGIEREEINSLKKLKNYYGEGLTIDYPEYPTQLAFIFSSLKRKGFEVRIFDFALHKWLREEWEEDIFSLKEYAPNLVLIFSRRDNFKDIEKVISTFSLDSEDRENLPKFVLLSYTAATDANKVFQRIGKYVPIISYAEIEPIIQSISGNSLEEVWDNLKNAPNIIYFDENNNATRMNRLDFLDLNELPLPEFTALDTEAYLKINNYIPLALSRGCPYNCRHCPTKKIYGTKWRGFQIAKIRSLLNLVKNVFKDKKFMVMLVDNNLVYDLNWLSEALQIFKQTKIEWMCLLRPDWVTEEVVEILASNNCKRVILSADVLSDYEPALANYLRKPISLDLLKNASQMIQRKGIEVGIYFIVNFFSRPEEILPKVIKKCEVDLVSLSNFHDYAEFNNSGVISAEMKKVLKNLKEENIRVNICTGWGEDNW
jgi:hypothetical protein